MQVNMNIWQKRLNSEEGLNCRSSEGLWTLPTVLYLERLSIQFVPPPKKRVWRKDEDTTNYKMSKISGKMHNATCYLFLYQYSYRDSCTAPRDISWTPLWKIIHVKISNTLPGHDCAEINSGNCQLTYLIIITLLFFTPFAASSPWYIFTNI